MIVKMISNIGIKLNHRLQMTVTQPIIRLLATQNTSGSSQMDTEDDVVFKNVNDKGVIILNRPKALNALNLSMVTKLHKTLKDWENSKSLVIIEGAGGKAFCAGGDVKTITTNLNVPDGSKWGELFFRTEYTVNYLIGTYKKPYIALINGITMGGGVGVSVHGKYRIATEKTLFAMPETAIGLFPDVGGSYVLPRLRNKLGLFLGLTGHRLKGPDVLHAGIATHYIPSERLEDLKQELLAPGIIRIDDVLNKYQPENLTKEFSLDPYMHQIDKCFSAPTVEEIVERLKTDGSAWALNIIETLKKMCPTSLKVTKSAIDRGSKLNLAECLKMEYRLACAELYEQSELYKGVRALLVDKNEPKWNPASLEQVTDEFVNKRFESFPENQDLLLSKM